MKVAFSGYLYLYCAITAARNGAKCKEVPDREGQLRLVNKLRIKVKVFG